MTTMISEVYEAFKEANVSEATARKAAEAVAAYEFRFAILERELWLLKWMVGGLYAMILPSLWLLLRVAAKVGALG